MQMNRDELFHYVSSLIDENRLNEAKEFTLKIEAEIARAGNDIDRLSWRGVAAPLLIDIGRGLRETELIARGIEHLHNSEQDIHEEGLGNVCYNLANGYSELWRLDPLSQELQVDTDSHLLARRYYRRATSCMTLEDIESGVASTAWTNYGNLLDGIGRNVEALERYDIALKLNPNMGMALGNRGVTLHHFALQMPGFNHLLIAEAISSIELALQQTDLTSEANRGFENSLQRLYRIVELHDEMALEQYESIRPRYDFHKFLCAFCAEHRLFLSPIFQSGAEGLPFYGDPLYVVFTPRNYRGDTSRKHILFLNEIKQEYVLGRYFLVQSQYRSPVIDAVDEGVMLVQPEFGFPVYFNTYVQLLQSALKQAVAVLDKVAYFIYDYCELETPAQDRVSFLSVWGDTGNSKIRKAFDNFNCSHLFALFTLARDLHKNGDWKMLIQDRGVVTHRFMLLHESQDQLESFAHLPNRHLDDFVANTIFALQIARSAVMYLTQFFNHFEFVKPVYEDELRKLNC